MLLIANHKLCQVDSTHSKLYILLQQIVFTYKIYDQSVRYNFCVLAQPIGELSHFFCIVYICKKNFLQHYLLLSSQWCLTTDTSTVT